MDMSDDVKWEDPPERALGRGGGVRVWEPRLAPLRDNPGRWANCGDHTSSTITNLRKGQIAGVDPSEFEFVGRNFDKQRNRVTIYARFVGKPNLKAAAS